MRDFETALKQPSGSLIEQTLLAEKQHLPLLRQYVYKALTDINQALCTDPYFGHVAIRSDDGKLDINFTNEQCEDIRSLRLRNAQLTSVSVDEYCKSSKIQSLNTQLRPNFKEFGYQVDHDIAYMTHLICDHMNRVPNELLKTKFLNMLESELSGVAGTSIATAAIKKIHRPTSTLVYGSLDFGTNQYGDLDVQSDMDVFQSETMRF